MIRPLNGNTHVRTRSSEGCEVLACGCAHDLRQWLQLCDAHYFEWSGLHEAARLGHLATLEQRP